MPILVRSIRLGLDEPEERLVEAVAKRLRVSKSAIRTYAIVRRSLDARRKDDIHFTYQMELDLDESHRTQRARLKRLRARDVVWLDPQVASAPECGTHALRERPVVIGFGPGGMFAALRLAQFGYRPIVFERGREVRRRHRDVLQRFYREGEFDPSSNLLFGEGGAGTYSDGKLYTRVTDPLCRLVLEVFYQHGADPDVLIDTRPHIGSDRLPTICSRIRKRIESLGGEVRFECHMDDIRVVDGRLEAVHLAGPGFQPDGTWLKAGPTVLAAGHSARDTIRLLHRRGVGVGPKPFQIGVRIEHPQAMVNRWQYGAAAGHNRLGPAEYRLVAKDAAGKRSDVFSFCMCPGGMILPTNESAGLVATNGASRARRSSPFANSGLVLTLDPQTLSSKRSSNPAVEALAYLERWEHIAFEATGESYRVPAQRASDFLRGARSDGQLETSYPLGGQWADIAALIPEPVSEALRRALPRLNEKFPGFSGDEALITAPETRASGPVRILRDITTRQAVNVAGLYPVGEGAGYSGGIVSTAVDGIKAADAIVRHYAPPD
ncbi:MAG: hypothetical protein JSU86_11295 [Phycisphaerales bacterium]|nr:MAG: hypothetical protein JSU86_11295 [Phycisphaerales bacterium]